MKDKKYAFLAIFGNRDWPPVCFGKVNGKRGQYADFGMIFLCIPCCYNGSGKNNSYRNPVYCLAKWQDEENKC